jgi:hypothetical protein
LSSAAKQLNILAMPKEVQRQSRLETEYGTSWSLEVVRAQKARSSAEPKHSGIHSPRDGIS